MQASKGTFLLLFPQFQSIPESVLDFLYAQAEKINADLYQDRYEEAVYLLTAHKCILYLRTLPQAAEGESATAAQTAQAGMARGVQTNKSVGGVSVGMSESTAATGMQRWGDLTQTEFGLQFITIARSVSAMGVYIP